MWLQEIYEEKEESNLKTNKKSARQLTACVSGDVCTSLSFVRVELRMRRPPLMCVELCVHMRAGPLQPQYKSVLLSLSYRSETGCKANNRKS